MTEFFEQYGIVVVATIFIGYMLFSTYMRNKKYAQQTTNLIENIKKGDYIVTVGGVYGTVENIKTVVANDETAVEEKLFVINSGDNVSKSLITINAKAVQAVVNEIKPKAKKAPAKKPAAKKTTKKEEK